MNFGKKIIGTLVIGCCLFGGIADQSFAAERTDTLKYTKSASTKSFKAGDKHLSVYTYCKGGSDQKIYFQEYKKGKWVTIKNASGKVLCSKSKEKKTYGGVPTKKGHKYRLHFVNPGKSNIQMKVQFIDGDVA